MTAPNASQSRRQRGLGGFTLIEVLVGAGLLTIVAVSWGSFVNSFGRQARKGRFDVHVSKEHKAMVGVVSTVSRLGLQLRRCVFDEPTMAGENPGAPRPHPYRFLDPTNDKCMPRGNPTDSDLNFRPDYITTTWTLYNQIWTWPNIGARYTNTPLNQTTDRVLNLVLDGGYLVGTIIPTAKDAGCTNCHDGVGGASKGGGGSSQVPDWIKPCDFNKAAHWTGVCATTGEPLAQRNMIGSRLGNLFLPNDAGPTAPAIAQMDAYFNTWLVNRQVTQFGLFNLSYGAAIRNYVRVERVNLPGSGVVQQCSGACNCAAPASCCPGATTEKGSCTSVCKGYDMSTVKCSCGKDCFQPCPPQCTGGFIRCANCITPDILRLNVPKVSVTSVAVNPDPGASTNPWGVGVTPNTNIKEITSAVVPP